MKSRLNVLTVGDGDLSCSLALKRAYPQLIEHLVVTTIVSSEQELLNIYPQSRQIIDILQSFETNVKIYYGIDATKLHLYSCLDGENFDVILFHHPHLGYDDEEGHSSGISPMLDEQPTLAAKHSCLLAHYLHSAKMLASTYENQNETDGTTPCFHLCLCGGAIQTWNLNETVERLDLEYIWNSPFPASSPIFSFYETLIAHDESGTFVKDGPTDTPPLHQRTKACRIKGKRKGHWLGKYGYRHQPTFPHQTQFQNNISNSYHIFLRPKRIIMMTMNPNPWKESQVEVTEEESVNSSLLPFRCPICNCILNSQQAVEAHGVTRNNAAKKIDDHA